MGCINFETTIIFPKIYRVYDARNASFIHLNIVSQIIVSLIVRNVIPSQQLRFLLLRIPDRHISSSIRRRVGIWQGICRKFPELLLWPGGLNCGSNHLRDFLLRELASPKLRNRLDFLPIKLLERETIEITSKLNLPRPG